MLGDATWTLILTTLGEHIFGYQVAVGALAMYVLLGAALIVTLPDVRPSSLKFVQPYQLEPADAQHSERGDRHGG